MAWDLTKQPLAFELIMPQGADLWRGYNAHLDAMEELVARAADERVAGGVTFIAICRKFGSEPPRTRTWNLEIKSLCRRSSSGCWKLQNLLKQAESTSSSLPNVSHCCSGLVSKLVSVTVSLTTARVREGPQNSLLYDCP